LALGIPALGKSPRHIVGPEGGEVVGAREGERSPGGKAFGDDLPAYQVLGAWVVEVKLRPAGVVQGVDDLMGDENIHLQRGGIGFYGQAHHKGLARGIPKGVAVGGVGAHEKDHWDGLGKPMLGKSLLNGRQPGLEQGHFFADDLGGQGGEVVGRCPMLIVVLEQRGIGREVVFTALVKARLQVLGGEVYQVELHGLGTRLLGGALAAGERAWEALGREGGRRAAAWERWGCWRPRQRACAHDKGSPDADFPRQFVPGRLKPRAGSGFPFHASFGMGFTSRHCG